MNVAPSTSFEARADGFPTGLTGTIGVRILDNAGGETLARTTVGITENPAGSGSYIVTLTSPATVGQFSLFWDTGVVSPSTTATEDLVVSGSAAPPIGVFPAGRDLVTLAEARNWLNIAAADTGMNTDLERLITDLSDRFHYEAEREFRVIGTNPQVRSFDIDASGWRYGVVHVGDLAAIDTVEVLDDDWTTILQTVPATDYSALPLNRADWQPIRRLQLNYGLGATRLRYGYRIRVTGNFGFPAVPGNVRQAVLDAIAANYDRDVEHYRQDLGATAAASQEGGNVIVIGGGRQRLLSLPPEPMAVAWSYRDPII